MLKGRSLLSGSAPKGNLNVRFARVPGIVEIPTQQALNDCGQDKIGEIEEDVR